MQVRNLMPEDLADLMQLSIAAGWNQAEEDWLRILRLEPDRCIGIEEDGRVVSSATAILYGTDLAWIGMVLTLPEYRGRGYARQLMERCIELCGEATMRLDASDMGKPLYESLGFVSECFVERWRREPAPSAPAPDVDALRVDEARDSEIFGARRSRLLAELRACGGASAAEAYGFVRSGRMGPYLGPCVSESPEPADALFRWFAAAYGGTSPTLVDVFPHHEHAPRIAGSLGFRPVRRLTRMVRKPANIELPDSRIYAIAGLEYG